MTDADGGSDADSLTAASTVDNCLVGYNLRQSGTKDVLVPFVHDVRTVTATSRSPDLTAVVISNADGGVSLRVTAHPGAALGPAIVHVAESTFGGASDRDVTFFVSPIMVASTLLGGKITNPGTIDEPFLTFQQAAAAAFPGDTIILNRLGPLGRDAQGRDVEQIEQNFAAAAAAELRNNVTVASPGITMRSELHMPIVLDGDATLDDLDIEEPRLTITEAGSTVELQGGMLVSPGITIAASASGATLHVFNAGAVGEIRNDPPTVTPSDYLDALLIEGAGANVVVENGGTVSSNSNTAAAIHSKAPSAVISIHGNTTIKNFVADGPSLQLDNLRSLDVDSANFIGSALISDSSSAASFTNSQFTIGGSDPDIQYNTPEIVFSGLTLNVSNSAFTGQAIVQKSGVVTLQNSAIKSYTKAGYRLVAGLLNAGTMADLGHNTFNDFFYVSNSISLGTQPVAFSIEVQNPPADGVVATSSASMFNGMQPGTCTASQTEKMSMDMSDVVTMDMPSIVSITTKACPIVVNFY